MEDPDRRETHRHHGLASRVAALVAACVAPLQRLRQAATAMPLPPAADSATTASPLAEQAGEIARRGGDVVQQVVSNVENIAEASQRIVDIIGVVDGVAFQANILALNAAIQAARQTEQRPGYAVVATEAKALSAKAAAAAARLKTDIGASVQTVESSARVVAVVGQNMGDVVASIHRVNALVAQLQHPAVPDAGRRQVDAAVGELDRMTSDCAELARQSAAAAQAVGEQAQRLADAVAQYQRLDTHPLSAAVEAEAAIARVHKPATD